VIVFGDGRPTPANAMIAIADKCIEVAVEQHGECHPAHRPGAAGDAPADAVLDAPVAKGALSLAGDFRAVYASGSLQKVSVHILVPLFWTYPGAREVS
jgi:hypothetical protein